MPIYYPNTREAAILALLINGELYGREIRGKLAQKTKQILPLGSLYTTLDRMEDKGLLRSRMGESEHERGGNRRKHYKITASGVASLNAVQLSLMPIKGELGNA